LMGPEARATFTHLERRPLSAPYRMLIVSPSQPRLEP
jgi:hypothetical protein